MVRRAFILFVLETCLIGGAAWAGQTYYTDQACSALGTCATTCSQAKHPSTPLPTINAGIGCLASGAGDTLIIKGGTYDELLIGNTFIAGTISAIQPGTELLVAGTSWDNPTTIKGAANESVVIQPTKNYPGGGGVITITNPHLRYVIFDNLILDANQKTTTGVYINNASYIRIQNSEVKNALSNGILLAVGTLSWSDVTSSYSACCHELINVDAHHNDLDLPCDPTSNDLRGHGGYVETPRTLIDGSRFHENAHAGVQFWSGHTGAHPDDSIIKNSVVYNNSLCTTRGNGIVTGSSRRLGIYNNVLFNNSIGISINSSETKIYNNTIYGNNKNSNTLGIFVNASDVKIKNNIVIHHKNNAILNWGAFITASNNLCDITTFGCSLVETDESKIFTNAANTDFTLAPGSPAIDAGVAQGEVLSDISGTSRPQGSAYDIGAFEFTPRDSVLPPPGNLRLRSQPSHRHSG